MSTPAAPPVAPEDRPDGPPPPSDRRPWYRRRWLLLLLGAVLLVVGIVGAAFGAIYMGAEIPSPDELEPPEPSVVFDATGEAVATLQPGAIEENLALEELPPHVPQAVLAAEDRDFRDHGGFSATGILRAAWANLTSGEVVQGASTIDQQYVSLAIAEIDDSFVGKFREVAVATKLDDELSKDRILEMYLNTVPFGRGVQGIQAAARTYFETPAQELDVNQAATLAGIIAAPSAYDPERNPEDARTRRDYVLRGMVDIGALDAGEAEQLIASPLPETRDDPLVQYGDDAYFLDAVRDAVPELLEDPSVDPYSDLAIHTTLDRRLQAAAVDALGEQLADTGYSGALVTVSPGNGAVRAAVGGLDFATQEFNVAVEGSRQAGSSFKPFALTAWVEDGYSPQSPVHAPRVVTVPGGDGTAEIHNYTQRGYGTISLHQATVLSANTAYVNLATQLGYDRVVDMAHDLGIQSELPEFPTTVLGAGGVNPMEMASAYATLAAEGVHHEPHVVTRIETLDGEVLYEHEIAGEAVIEPNTAAVVTDVLADVVRTGTGTAAAIDRPAAGKTGTTNDYRDAWFVGYTPELATAVWVGNLDNSPMDRVTGGSFPALAWSTFMSEALAETEPSEFPEPDLSGLEIETIDGITRARTEDDDEPTSTPDPAPAPEPTTTETEAEPSPTATATETDPSPTTQPEETSTEGEGSTSPPEETSSETAEPSQEPSPSEDEGLLDGDGDGSGGDGSTSEPSPSDGSTSDGSTDDTQQTSNDDGSTSEPSPSDGSTSDGSTDDTQQTSTSDGSTDDTQQTSTSDGATSEPSPTPSPTTSG